MPFPGGVSGWGACGGRAETWECSVVCKAKWCSVKHCHSPRSEETRFELCPVVSFLGNYQIFHVFCGFFVVSSCAGGQLVLWWGMWSLLAPREAPKWRLTQSLCMSCPELSRAPGPPLSTSEPESLGRAVRNLLSKLYNHTNKFIFSWVLTRVCRAKYSGKVWTFYCFPVRIHFIAPCEDRCRWLPYKISLIRMI